MRLRQAAADVIVEKGLGSFSLREVARRAGVSHAAPAHHFGDTAGLLTSLAIEAFEYLHTQTAEAAASETDAAAALTAIGRAYVRVGLENPAHCEVVFRHDLVNADDPEYLTAGAAAYGVLEAALIDLADDINPDLDLANAGKLCWAAMQGLVVLYKNMSRLDDHAGRSTDEIDQLVTAFTGLLIEGFRDR